MTNYPNIQQFVLDTAAAGGAIDIQIAFLST